MNIAEKWDLTEAQARNLLGGVASSTWHAWKTGPRGKQLDQDTLTRIANAKPGDRVKVTGLRGEQQFSSDVVVSERPSSK